MNAHELRTSLEKAETQPEIVVRPRFGKRTTLDGHLTCGGLGQPKAEKKLRFSAQPETKTSFTKGLRQFSAKNKNSLKESIVGADSLPRPVRTEDQIGRAHV